LNKITQIIHEDVATIEADIAATYYQFPSQDLFMIGITGTSGKTTTSYLVKHLLDSCNIPTGLIGSVEYILGKNTIASNLTTPDSISNQKYLREMLSSDLKAAVMEVCSHSLVQNRVKNIEFDVAVFTNLTQDHFDYHKTFEEYGNAKKILFDSIPKEGLAIVNSDDGESKKMIAGAKCRILSYGIEKSADLMAKNIGFSLNGLEFDLLYQGQVEKISSNLIGKYNVYNILASILVAIEAKIPLREIKKAISSFINVRGRLERVKTKKKFHIFVDYAHKPDALKNVLLTLNEIKKKKIITVFGCGGDRDRDKRPKMGKIASDLSDFCIITSDNPRKEDPKTIILEIEKGIAKKNYLIEENRFDAIEKAIKLAQDDDIILIAGKGHETTQIFANNTALFDDRKVAVEIASKL
jgi:UDP-N-acetylmuramoyl-L-alanyl-D-glutamate--2,6-diaminopimelate ligase